MASEPASRVKPVTKQTFGRASPEAAREAATRAVTNGALEETEPSARDDGAAVASEETKLSARDDGAVVESTS